LHKAKEIRVRAIKKILEETKTAFQIIINIVEALNQETTPNPSLKIRRELRSISLKKETKRDKILIQNKPS